MIKLKTSEGKVIVLYSFETSTKLMAFELGQNRDKPLFSGTKSELLEKGEEFWKPLVKSVEWYFPENHKVYWNYKESEDYDNIITGEKKQRWGVGFATVKESGISALSNEKGEFIIITSEKI